MLSVIYVHGIGVREQYWDNLKKVEAQFSEMPQVGEVLPCAWGETLGAKLNLDGASIPDSDYDAKVGVSLEFRSETRVPSDDDVNRLSEEDYLFAIWEILYQDPYFELRLLATQQEMKDSDARGSLRDFKDFRIKDLQEKDADLYSKLEQDESTQFLDDAQHELSRSEILELAAERVSRDDSSSFAEVYARALVALAIQQALEVESPKQLDLAINADLRDETVDLIVKIIMGSERGPIKKFIGKQIWGFIGKHGTDYVAKHRRQLSDLAYAQPADTLLYQAYGEGIRDFITTQVQKAKYPVVLFAHSLGGIACVDMLINELKQRDETDQSAPFNVKLLATIGSQAPFFYEINALSSQQLDLDSSAEDRLPKYFPEWINFYDRRDFLSYVGEGIFGKRIADIPVDSRLPFPQSHGAYIERSEVWGTLRARIESL